MHNLSFFEVSFVGYECINTMQSSGKVLLQDLFKFVRSHAQATPSINVPEKF